MLPAFPVLFVQTIFNRSDRIFLTQLFPVCNQFFGGELRASLRKHIFPLPAAFPFAGSCIHCQNKIGSRLVTSLLDRFQNNFDCFFVAAKVRCETALIANGGCKASGLQQSLQCVKYFCTPAKPFGKALCTNRHNHKLLHIYGVRCMCAAV